MEITRMTPETARDAAALEEEFFSRPWSAQGFVEALEQEQNIFLTAEGEKGFLGYCGLYVAGDEGEITNVAVQPDAQRQGIAQALLAELFAQARAQSVAVIYLEVRESNDAARQLYEKLGFDMLSIRRNFYELPAEDAIVMRKVLSQR